MFQGRLVSTFWGAYIGEKFKRQFGAVFTNPKDKVQRTSIPKTVACGVLFLLLLQWRRGSEGGQTGRHQLLTCLASIRKRRHPRNKGGLFLRLPL